MNKKQQHILSQFALFRCPLCHSAMHPQGGSLQCANRHTFDVSRKGHVNFVPAQQPMKYTRELFMARQRIFQGQFYEPVARRIKELIDASRAAAGKDRLHITDAGCGQGYYTKYLASSGEDLVIGFDLSADAIALASSGNHMGLFLVSDLTNIPLADHTQDVVLDVLTQANYHEFSRILKKGGTVLKVIPGPDYLKEIRDLLQGRLRREAYSADAVLEHFTAHHENVTVQALRYTVSLESCQADDFLLMTPLTLQIDPAQIRAEELRGITIHLLFLTGTPLEHTT